MSTLSFQARVDSPGDWYRTFVVYDIRGESGSAVTANRFLYLSFKTPSVITEAGFNWSPNPWQAVKPVVISSRQIDSALFLNEARLELSAPYTFRGQDVINIGVNGEFTGNDYSLYLDSFSVAADEELDVTGAVVVSAAAMPDPALIGATPVVRFAYGDLVEQVTVPFGATQTVKLPAGQYRVSAQAVSNADETVSVPVIVSSAEIVVVQGGSAALDVSFGTVVKHGSIDVIVSPDLQELATESLSIELINTATGAVLDAFSSPVGRSTPLRGLPFGANVELRVATITLNNIVYTVSPQRFTLGTQAVRASIDWDSITRTPQDTTGFASVDMIVRSADELPASGAFVVRLNGPGWRYAAALPLRTGTVTFPALIEPGVYAVQADDFVTDGALFTVAAPASVTVPSGAIELTLERTVDLRVPGFPDFLAFGGCADMTPTNLADFTAARASAIFK
jgi:hypothetical protein